MKRQKKNQTGITLIALVISIIVMLILAGVSLNATVGENGILTKAQEASRKQKIATELENLNLELTKVNIDTISNDEAVTIQDVVNYLIEKGVIDRAVTTSSGEIAAGVDMETGNRYFFGVKGENTYKIIRGKDDILIAEFVQNSSGGEIAGGYILVTEENFNNSDSVSDEEKGKFMITDDAEVAFMDSISGELSIYVKEGVHATIGIYANMTLTNTGISRSAIDIEPRGILDLYVGEGVTLNVNSGLGEKGDESDYMSTNQGGYAGIHVPVDATINLKGNGTVVAYGGDAGDGNTYTGNTSGSLGGSGGGGAGAGIGGNGGYGSGYAVGKGSNGGAGEDCGTVNIYGTVTVKAYGGAGGAGADGTVQNGGGAGGYPGAGIGGGGAGGAGGTCCAGGGGYSGGGADGFIGKPDDLSGGNRGYGGKGGINGNGSERVMNTSYPLLGGFGYNEEDVSIIDSLFTYSTFTKIASGMGGVNSRSAGHYAGDGGTAGKGGDVYVNNTGGNITVEGKQVLNKATVHAFNGNKYTDGTSYNDGVNQTEIYAQKGIVNTKYIVTKVAKGILEYTVSQEESTVEKSGYTNPKTSNTQGVGSGAGYVEVSNGHYYLCNESNGILTPQ